MKFSAPQDKDPWRNALVYSWQSNQIECDVPMYVSSGFVKVIRTAPLPKDTSNNEIFTVTFSYRATGWSNASLPVQYYVSLTGAPAGALAAIQAGFQTWENVPSAYMDFKYLGEVNGWTPGPGNGKNEVYWTPLENGYIAQTEWTP